MHNLNKTLAEMQKKTWKRQKTRENELKKCFWMFPKNLPKNFLKSGKGDNQPAAPLCLLAQRLEKCTALTTPPWSIGSFGHEKLIFELS